MTLEKQLVGIPIKGLSAHADPKNTNVGELSTVSNMVFKRTARGGAELRKRYGGAALTKGPAASTDVTVTSGAKLATFDNERLLLAADTLHSYSPQLVGWTAKGKISGVGLTVDHIAEVAAAGTSSLGPGSFVAPDVAVSGNLMAVAWVDTRAAGRGAYLTVFDLTTGDRVLPETIVDTTNLSAASWVRVVPLATTFMVVIANGGTGNIRAVSVTYTSMTIAGPTNIAADLNASAKGDVTRNGTNDSVLIAYHTTVPNLKVLVINSNRTAGANSTVGNVPDQCIGWLHWDFSDGIAYFGYVGAAVGLVRASTPVGAAPAIAGTVADAAAVAAAQVTGFHVAGGISNLFIEVRAASTFNCLVKWWSQTFGGAVTTLIRSVGIGARVFKVGTKYYLPFAYESPLQNTYFVGLVDGVGTLPPIVARSLYGLGGGLSVTANVGGSTVLADNVTALVPLMRLSSKPAGTAFYGIAVARLDFSGTGLSSPKRVGDNLHIPGGVVRAYAGEGTFNVLAEAGFFLFPETPTLAQNAGAGNLTLLGAYQYLAVYSFTDAKGQNHRSAPSAIASVTMTGANQRVDVTVPTLRVSAKIGAFAGAGNLGIEIYRTQASGTVFYRISQQTLNDPTVDTVLVQDTASDVTVGANDEVYTTGKVLPHISPPSAKLMESWRNRLFLAGTENPLEVWPSNEYATGEGVSFSDALVVTMEADGGPITALCEMDDRLLIFKRNAIYALGGNGPTLTGANTYEQPVRVCSFVGAIGQGGVVKTRDGVMFQSARGIYLYNRGGETVYAGAGVESSNATTQLGACVLENEEQVRWVNASGVTQVYHYGHRDENGIGLWTQFTGQVAVDCIMWNGTFAYLQSDGTVVEETVGVYVDPGAVTYNVAARVQWINLTQFFGRFRLYSIHVLYEPLASFTINHRISYDFVTSPPAETGSLAVTATLMPPLVISTARRRVTAVQIYLDENSTTAGFRLSGLGVEVGLEPGATKPGMEKFFG